MTVRTVLGDVEASSLRAVYMHEHLILDNALIARDYPHIHLPSVDEAIAEVTPCASEGVGCMVDAMPAAGGRRPARLAEVSARTGVAIVAMTGLHTPKYYVHHPWAITAEPDVLADLFVADIVEGIDEYDYTGPVVERTTVRAGMIKVATERAEVTDRERRVFTAAADAANRTGVQILTHCEDGIGAMEQLSFFTALEFPLDRVVVSHTDKVVDLGYHRDIMATGAFVEYDQALRRPPGKDNDTARVAAAMVREGFGDRIMFGTDGARRTLWSSLGGAPGLAWMRTGFIDALTAHGVSGAEIDTMYTTNAQRFLTMREARV